MALPYGMVIWYRYTRLIIPEHRHAEVGIPDYSLHSCILSSARTYLIFCIVKGIPLFDRCFLCRRNVELFRMVNQRKPAAPGKRPRRQCTRRVKNLTTGCVEVVIQICVIALRFSWEGCGSSRARGWQTNIPFQKRPASARLPAQTKPDCAESCRYGISNASVFKFIHQIYSSSSMLHGVKTEHHCWPVIFLQPRIHRYGNHNIFSFLLNKKMEFIGSSYL